MRKFFTGIILLAMFVLVTTYGNAQGPKGGRGGPDPRFLVKNKSVQEEIKLTSEQKEKLEPKFKEMDEKQKELFEQQPKGKVDQGKMQAKMKEMMGPLMKSIDEVLTTEQKDRLKQIHYQRLGVRAMLTDPHVGDQLDLTEEQAGKIKSVVDEQRKEMDELFKELKANPTDPAEVEKKMKALGKEALDKAVKVLGKDQKAKWEALIGKPFEMKMEMPKLPKKNKDKE